MKAKEKNEFTNLSDFLFGEQVKPWYSSPNYLLAALAWVNWFALSWLLMFEWLDGWFCLVLWFLFLFVALGAAGKRKAKAA